MLVLRGEWLKGIGFPIGATLKGGIAELKVDVGPGFRVYYTQRGLTLIILLCGGDKSTQQADIRRARRIAEDWDS